MTRMDDDIAEWQRKGPLFGCYDDPRLPGDRLCIETHNVYHHDRVVQVGPYSVHKRIFESHFYPPTEEHYAPKQPKLDTTKTILLAIGLALIGLGIGFLLPV